VTRVFVFGLYRGVRRWITVARRKRDAAIKIIIRFVVTRVILSRILCTSYYIPTYIIDIVIIIIIILTSHVWYSKRVATANWQDAPSQNPQTDEPYFNNMKYDLNVYPSSNRHLVTPNANIHRIQIIYKINIMYDEKNNFKTIDVEIAGRQSIYHTALYYRQIKCYLINTLWRAPLLFCFSGTHA